ncbi:hypothetical protein MVES_003263 [Malassezia vespertilionis]|uniref:RING-type domain-containing protein n=1 Tax=Malassezia vespertilionis TaxID=2020962 RepID=A0A2N1J888_9BASI|nr:hypothetical protein MVES_003263 [Malassezia vespertilionis]
MTRHSKQNTAAGHFTYAEYQMLKDRWGTRKLRLSTENMRAFQACYLCLQDAQRPVCCSEGHMYCKECILSDILGQKSQLSMLAKQRDELRAKEQEKKMEAEQAASRRRIEAFALGESSTVHPTLKRKLGDDECSPREHTEKHGKTEARIKSDATMPAFWLPSMAPQADANPSAMLAQDRVSTTLCIAGKPHKLTYVIYIPNSSTKGLVDVHFAKRTTDTKPQLYCPSCKKEFSTSSHPSILRKCGHVLCAPCTKELVHIPLQQGERVGCPDCSAAVEKQRDVIALARDGTGFASDGTAEIKSDGVAFQG